MWYIVQRFAGDLPFYVVRAEADVQAVERAMTHANLIEDSGTRWQVQELCTVDPGTMSAIAAGHAVVLGIP